MSNGRDTVNTGLGGLIRSKFYLVLLPYIWGGIQIVVEGTSESGVLTVGVPSGLAPAARPGSM